MNGLVVVPLMFLMAWVGAFFPGVIFRGKIADLRRKIDLLTRERDALRDERTMYAACPECFALVALHGAPLTGRCHYCGYIVTQYAAPLLDPLKLVEAMRTLDEESYSMLLDQRDQIKQLRMALLSRSPRQIAEDK